MANLLGMVWFICHKSRTISKGRTINLLSLWVIDGNFSETDIQTLRDSLPGQTGRGVMNEQLFCLYAEARVKGIELIKNELRIRG